VLEILHFDEYLFRLINDSWQHPFLDNLLPWWRNKYNWIPFYLILVIFLIYQFQLKGLYLILFAILTIGVADITSSQLIKKTVKRVRPCNDMAVQSSVHLLVPCGGGYSFTSSHATNHFALAFFLIFALGKRFKNIKWPLIIWAGMIALAQVYVGVHYPFDVIGGALLGIIIARFIYYLYETILPNQQILIRA